MSSGPRACNCPNGTISYDAMGPMETRAFVRLLAPTIQMHLHPVPATPSALALDCRPIGTEMALLSARGHGSTFPL